VFLRMSNEVRKVSRAIIRRHIDRDRFATNPEVHCEDMF
jgi:hypothetical protein